MQVNGALTNEEQLLLTALKESADEQGIARVQLDQGNNPILLLGLMAKGRIWKRTVQDGEMICHLCDYE